MGWALREPSCNAEISGPRDSICSAPPFESVFTAIELDGRPHVGRQQQSQRLQRQQIIADTQANRLALDPNLQQRHLDVSRRRALSQDLLECQSPTINALAAE